MAKILLKIWSAVSHYNATFALAKSLRACGHEVVYAGVEELRPYVEPQGFSFVVHEERGLFNPFLGRHPVAPGSHWKQFKSLMKTGLRRVRRGGSAPRQKPDPASAAFMKILERVQPDAVLLDAHYTLLAQHLLVRRVVFGILSTKVCLDRFSGLPPIQSDLVPDGSRMSRLRADLAWRSVFARRQLFALLRTGRPFGVARLASETGRSEADFETHRSLFTGVRCVPEFLLSPREFDFPHPVKPHQRHVSGLPDLERTDSNHDVAFSTRFALLRRERAEGRPLVYCSLGTIAWRYRGMADFLRRLVAAAERQGWNLLLAAGSDVNPRMLYPLPANVTVLQRVPQVAVLREADAMVTHGGMNSVKECIALGVPMLVYPGDSDIDQGGNSARVVYHGLGLRGQMRRDTAPVIRAKISRLLGEPDFRRRVQAMAARIERSDAHVRAATIVEEALSLQSNHVLQLAN